MYKNVGLYLANQSRKT